MTNSIVFRHGTKQGDHNLDEILQWWIECNEAGIENCSIEGTDCATYHPNWDCLLLRVVYEDGTKIELRDGDELIYDEGNIKVSRPTGIVH